MKYERSSLYPLLLFPSIVFANDFELLSAYQMTLKIENAAITQLENTFKKQPIYFIITEKLLLSG